MAVDELRCHCYLILDEVTSPFLGDRKCENYDKYIHYHGEASPSLCVSST